LPIGNPFFVGQLTNIIRHL